MLLVRASQSFAMHGGLVDYPFGTSKAWRKGRESLDAVLVTHYNVSFVFLVVSNIHFMLVLMQTQGNCRCFSLLLICWRLPAIMVYHDSYLQSLQTHPTPRSITRNIQCLHYYYMSSNTISALVESSSASLGFQWWLSVWLDLSHGEPCCITTVIITFRSRLFLQSRSCGVSINFIVAEPSFSPSHGKCLPMLNLQI